MEISAITITTTDMARATRFYGWLGLELHRGGESATFSTFRIGSQHLNLRLVQQDVIDTGDTLLIIAVEDVDALYQRFLAQGFQADFEPRNGAWGERYFHTRDPDGNRISFAKRIDD